MPEYYLRVKTKNGDESLGPTQPYPNLEEALSDLIDFGYELMDKFMGDEENFILIDKTFIKPSEIISFGLVEVFPKYRCAILDGGSFTPGPEYNISTSGDF
jgi:hypothetical protein